MAASEEDDDVPPSGRAGRFVLPHRDGARVEVGEPQFVGGARPWLCSVKLLGRNDGPLNSPMHTLLVRVGRGDSPEESQREAIAQLTLVYGTPFEAAPSPVIKQMPSTMPPPKTEREREPDAPPRGLWSRMRRWFG